MTKKIDEREFRALWVQGVPVSVLAEYFDVSCPAITQRRIRLALKRQSRTTVQWAEQCRRKLGLLDGSVVEPPRPVFRAVQRGPRPLSIVARAEWTEERLRRLREEGGTYAARSRLALQWGVSLGDVTARWHALRVAA